MKTVLFVPGFREDMNSRDYKSTLAAIESKGHEVKFVPIDWSRTTIDDWAKELEKEYSKHNPSETILAGFSYGAMAAFIAAVGKNPSELWLFSFSPYFSDDLPYIKKSWLAKIGYRRAVAFGKLDFNMLAKKIMCKTIIIVGKKEATKNPLIGRRAQLAHQKIANNRLIVVNDAGHDVSDKNYITAIKDVV